MQSTICKGPKALSERMLLMRKRLRCLITGQNRVTGNLEGFSPDFACEISDEEALTWTHRLLKEARCQVAVLFNWNTQAIEVQMSLAWLNTSLRVCYQ